MRRWITTLAITAALSISGGAVQAQDEDEDGGGGRRGQDNYAFGVGVGLVEPSADTETYFMASFRIKAHRSNDEDSDEDMSQNQGISGYFEPEVGYWKRGSEDGNNISGSDTLVGINLLGVVPFSRVDTFFGVGAGVHFIDAKLLTGDARETGSDSKLGLNAQFGVDVYLSEKWSAFGAGRFDLIQDSQDDVQTKIYLGLRTRW